MKSSLTIFSVILWLNVSAQNLHYDIVRNDNHIGSLDVLEKWNGQIQTYSILNQVEFKVLFSFRVVYSLTESFEKGMLVSGQGYNTLNDMKQKETTIQKNEDGSYELLIDGITAMGEKSAIFESMAKVYHQEPIEEKRCYSQYFGTYLTFEDLGDHRYRLRSPDGENIYKYEYGYCTEVKVIRDFATFYIKIKPETLATIKSRTANKE
ncbi:DUF6134 family protein [Marinoscillum sp. MHG1-6]|uniref:DUF6134 family protein n=1 Tax=Marinoscillum sp. MHG1-6 TaxID=2959627 RepID=UPI0021578AE1|nr:DUF6134 family protein [Marinoscillum sp. MHG1-6]